MADDNMTDKEIAVALMQLLDAAAFPGSARKKVTAIAEWLDKIANGEMVAVAVSGDGEA